MLSGKFSARADGAHPPEAVIDEALAAKYFPKGDAIVSFRQACVTPVSPPC